MAQQRSAAASGHPWPAWFQDSVQHAQLLTNRTLREYLLAHSAERWPELAKATLLYGVLCLRRDFPGQAVLPLDHIHEAARRLHAQQALGAALPAIRSQFDSLEAELGGCLAELDANAAAAVGRGGGSVANAQAPPPARRPSDHRVTTPTVGPAGPAPAPRRAASASVAPSPAAAPASLRRSGASHSDGSELPAQPPRARKAAPIYPDWWPGDARNTSASRRPPASARQRPQPRLAYSQPPAAPPSVTADDLPTAAFLLVPPRVATHGGGGGGGNGGGGERAGRRAGPAGQAAAPTESRVKLQHAQRLALRRQEGREQRRAGENAGGPGGSASGAAGECGGSAAAAGAAGQGSLGPGPGSPAYQPEAVARWMQHFGL